MYAYVRCSLKHATNTGCFFDYLGLPWTNMTSIPPIWVQILPSTLSLCICLSEYEITNQKKLFNHFQEIPEINLHVKSRINIGLRSLIMRSQFHRIPTIHVRNCEECLPHQTQTAGSPKMIHVTWTIPQWQERPTSTIFTFSRLQSTAIST